MGLCPLQIKLEVEILVCLLIFYFLDFVHSNAFIGLGFVGNKFTWSNH
jgi:hypothetical protein